MDASKEFTDVWTFPSVRPYKGKHPAEKPAAMLEHAIERRPSRRHCADCFGGGGSAALAALKLNAEPYNGNRPHWAAEIASRVEDAVEHDAPFAPARNGNDHLLPRINGSKSRQLALFSAGK